MATELKTFTGSQFIGKPVLADIEFIPHLKTINDFAATNDTFTGYEVGV